MKVYSIYDSKAESWNPPFVAHNHEIAKRDLLSAINGNPNIPPAQYPTDFALICLGEWNPGIPNPLVLAQIQENIGTIWMIQAEFNARRKASSSEVSNENGTV